MKRKHTFPFFMALVFMVLLVALTPVQRTAAQSEEDPDFVITLALMAVADDRLDGVMDASALSNLRAVVDDYYTQQSYLQMDTDTRTALNQQKQVVLSALDHKIDFQKTLSYRAQLALFTAMVDANDYSLSRDPDVEPLKLYNAVLSTGHKPDPEAVAMLQQRLAAGTQSALQQNLDGRVAAGVQGGSALVGQSSGAVYDFDAGQAQGGVQTVQPRPINFTNTGSRTVYVSVEYYQPPKGLAVASPAMDVEVPGQSSIVMTGFPQGNYVFCMDWETDLDKNGDGIKDYDRAVVRGWVSAGHPEDPQQAQVIHVGASFSETPTGRCVGFVGEAPGTEEAMTEAAMTEEDPGYGVVEPAEEDTQEPPDDDGDGSEPGSDDGGSLGADFWDQSGGPDDDRPAGYTLTLFEEVNQGGHAYKTICYEKGVMSDTTYFHSSWSFSDEGVYLDGTYFYARVSANEYKNSEGTKIIFSSNGFTSDTYYKITSSEGVEETVRRTCSAQIDD